MRHEWETVTLRDVLESVSRRIVLNEHCTYRPIGIRWYGNGPFLKKAKLGAEIAAKSMNAVLPGDIVYSKLFAWKGSFGVISDDYQGSVASGEFPTFVPDQERLLPAFFSIWARRKEVWEAANEASTGTTAGSRNRLSQDDFLDLEIDLPPFQEQQAIVAAVDRASRLETSWLVEAEAARKTLYAVREHLLQTDGWYDLSQEWALRALSEVADIRSGITKGRKPRGKLISLPFIRAANVQTEFLDLSEIKTFDVSQDEIDRFALEVGDLLLIEGSGSPARLGSGWLWEGQLEEPVVCQNHVFRVRGHRDRILPPFLAHAVHASPARAHFLEAAKTTSGLATINKSQVGDLCIPVPPISIQETIVGTLGALRDVETRALTAGMQAAGIRATVVNELLSGRQVAPALAV